MGTTQCMTRKEEKSASRIKIDEQAWKSRLETTSSVEPMNTVSDQDYISFQNRIQSQMLFTPCTKHPSFSADLLLVKVNDIYQDNIHICIMCVQDQNLSSDSFISIKQLIQSSSNEVLLNYPPIQNHQLSHSLQSITHSTSYIIDQMDKFLVQCKNEFDKAFEIAKANTKMQINQLIQLRDNCLASYKELAEIEKLKGLVNSNESDKYANDQLLRTFLSEKYQQSRINTNILQKEVDEFEQMSTSFSLEPSKKVLKAITKSITDIDLFASSIEQMIQPEERHSMLSPQLLLKPSLQLNNSSKNLKLSRNESTQCFEITHIGETNQVSQCYLDYVFKPSLKYIVRIDIEQRSSSELFQFMFGIMPEQKKNQEFAYSYSLTYDEFNATYGISKMVKGKQLHSGVKTNVKRSLEMQIYIKNKHLRVCSLPEYSEIAELNDKSKLHGNIPYILGFYLYCPKDFIRIVEVAAVDTFDERTNTEDNNNNEENSTCNYDTDDNCQSEKGREFDFKDSGYIWSRAGSVGSEVKRIRKR